MTIGTAILLLLLAPALLWLGWQLFQLLVAGVCLLLVGPAILRGLIGEWWERLRGRSAPSVIQPPDYSSTTTQQEREFTSYWLTRGPVVDDDDDGYDDDDDDEEDG